MIMVLEKNNIKNTEVDLGRIYFYYSSFQKRAF